MYDEDVERLTYEVLELIQQHPSYDPFEHFEVTWSESDHFYILYGPDLQAGAAGFGDTPEEAFRDFKRNWRDLISSPDRKNG